MTSGQNSRNTSVGNSPLILNSGEGNNWSLQYGPQDKNVPKTPAELKKSNWEKIPALVPGNVEIDLMNSGKIKDPSIGSNVYDLRKFETYQWWYHLSFKKPAISEGQQVELIFNGIDCIAEVWMNDQKIGSAANMFIRHRFDVTGRLLEQNDLYVCIFSPVLEGRKYTRESLGTRIDASPEAVNIRKAPHMFGWDILPRIVSAGLWKDVRIDVIQPTKWKLVYWATKNIDLDKKTAELSVDWEFSSDRLNIDDLKYQIVIERNNKVITKEIFPVYTTCGRQRVQLKDVDFWWPRGYGDPALYEAKIQLIESDKSVVDEVSHTIGIRKASLVRSEIVSKENPGEFVFTINNEKIFVHGTNWVALDALHSKDKRHLNDVFAMLIDLNCNMVRCWGGNVYESDEFYKLCDGNGIMVWQDFAMGCTFYPQNQDFLNKINIEAREIILQLRNHPSIVLWAGNNENDVSLSWNDDQSFIDPNTDMISRQLLPSLVRQFDPERSYLPSSPYISPEAFKKAGKIDETIIPEVHLWGPRGFYKAPFYTETNAHFVSEIGYHGCPARESLEQMMDKDFVYPWKKNGEWNDQWQTKAVRSHPSSIVTISRNDLMVNQVKCIFGKVPADLDSFILASQIVQAEAMKYFIELWRMDKFQKTGILWWNLRDGWPVISDAVVDYYNRKKLAYYYIKRVQADVCVMIGDAKEKMHPVVVVNDTRNDIKGSLAIKDARSGKIIFEKPFIVAKNGKTTEGFLPESKETSLWLIEWNVNGTIFQNHYLAFNPPIKLDDYLKWLPLIKK